MLEIYMEKLHIIFLSIRLKSVDFSKTGLPGNPFSNILYFLFVFFFGLKKFPKIILCK